jgi:hypothetical protein
MGENRLVLAPESLAVGLGQGGFASGFIVIGQQLIRQATVRIDLQRTL